MIKKIYLLLVDILIISIQNAFSQNCNSSKNILEFLQNERNIKVTEMINMETGASGVAGFILSNGVKSSELSGKMES